MQVVVLGVAGVGRKEGPPRVSRGAMLIDWSQRARDRQVALSRVGHVEAVEG